MRELARLDTNYEADLLQSFMECAGWRLTGFTDSASWDPTFAYTTFIYEAGDNPDCEQIHCGDSLCSQADWDSFDHETWHTFKGCTEAFDPTLAIDPEAERDTIMEACSTYCEKRYTGFVEELIRTYREQGFTVQSKDSAYTISLEQIYCQAKSLVAHCQSYCELTVFKNDSGYVDSIGTQGEIDSVRKAMFYSYTLALFSPDEGACPGNFDKVSPLPGPKLGKLAALFLNYELGKFRFSLLSGGQGAMWNYADVLLTLNESLNCNTQTNSVWVNPHDTSWFFAQTPETGECLLFYAGRNADGTWQEKVVCHLNTFCNTTSCDTLCLKWISPILEPNDTSFHHFDPISCERATADYIRYYVDQERVKCENDRADSLQAEYLRNCVEADSIEDVFVVSYELGYHHFTLYYYDRAGSLVRTVPPEGVAGGSAANRQQTPNHTLATEYAYNSLRQLTRQKTPDGGETHFWYNKMGQLRFSQNEKQLAQNRYSYTKYDSLGRIIETGESSEAGIGQAFALLAGNPDFPLLPLLKGDQTHTRYTKKAWDKDFGHPVRYLDGREQSHLRNRVSEVVAIQNGGLLLNLGSDTVKTVYSYDTHGNVEWMMQDVPGLRRTYIHYEYDLVSGNVTKVAYNDHPSRIDRFYHRYEYDADNRITRVETSRDGIIWDTDARYDYYAHGPLERTEIGHDKLQGTDYVYNLHGWLKAMNHPTLTTANDPGSDDGLPGNFGADAWGMQLNYYNGDFDRTGSPFSSGHSSYLAPERELFNGNISSWASHIAHQEGTLQYEQLTGQKFHYDELNRLTRSKFHAHNGSWSFTQDYESDYTYDANGNILTLNRNAYASNALGMDSMTYNYYAGTNQLEYVQDDVPAANYDVDIDNQQPDNYLYDAIGNLIKDEAEGIDAILWTVQGKVREVHKDNGDTLVFLYDGNGNRVKKEVRTSTDTVITYYTRDAQGNSMAIHERTRPDSMYEYRIKELPIYGSERIGVYKPDLLYKRQAPEDCEGGCCCVLSACYNKDMNWHSGMFTRDIGKRAYQHQDHLGNVRVTFSDVKHSTLDVNGLPDGVFVSVSSYNNYYGFGMLQVDRGFSSDSHRFGFNSMEKDDEIKGSGNSYNFGARIYDPRIGRFLSKDPVGAFFPTRSPYHFAGNNPIMMVDIDGEENMIYIYIDKSHPKLQNVDTKELMAKVNWIIKKVHDHNPELQVIFEAVEAERPLTEHEIDLTDISVVVMSRENANKLTTNKEFSATGAPLYNRPKKHALHEYAFSPGTEPAVSTLPVGTFPEEWTGRFHSPNLTDQMAFIIVHEAFHRALRIAGSKTWHQNKPLNIMREGIFLPKTPLEEWNQDWFKFPEDRIKDMNERFAEKISFPLLDMDIFIPKKPKENINKKDGSSRKKKKKEAPGGPMFR